MTSTIASLALPGIRIDSVEDPAAAITLCSSVHFDCVLVDYDMPGLNGLELAHTIREQDAFVPILLCSGVGNETLVADAMKMGVSDYLPKACISMQALRDAIGDAIEHADRARTMASQTKDLEMFAFALAHEFKQPLRQIVTLADLARQEGRAPDGSRLGTYLDFLSDAAERLDALVDVLSDYTVLAAPPGLEAIDLNEVLNGLIAQEDLTGAARGTVTLQGACSTVLGHEILLGHVFENLISNGLKYNASGEPRVDIRLMDRMGHVEVHVADNGIGIASEYLEYIFQPLSRLHTRSRYQGAGIGLSLARKAASAMNGAIRCESVAGKGSTFILTLQTAQAANRPESTARHNEHTLGES